MHKARAFFFVCAGVFLLALSYHLGARNATAQAPGNPVVGLVPYGGLSNTAAAVTANGDVYRTSDGNLGTGWVLAGNIFGGPVPVQRESFGAMKSRYRGERGVAQPARDR